ncbi:hypothetical protein DB346_00860 [Verrucomicrobia bacterium LW23]|nr:hypothetical protein DB346_00860 [Verrucomicrobia bacterium LW23]
MLLAPHSFAPADPTLSLPARKSPRSTAAAIHQPPLHARTHTVLRALAMLMALLAGGASLSLLSPATAAAGVFEEIGKEVNEIYQRTRPGILKVRSEGMVTLAGSGFFIDDKGTILTADAILGANQVITVDYNGVRMQAQVLGRDRRSGIAMLRIDAQNTPALTFGKAADLGPGRAVIIIGYPLNMAAAPSFGFISGVDFRYMNRIFATSHIRAAVPIMAGQVGGPMLNTSGEVVGMVITAIDDGRGVYALPSEAMTKMVGDFRQFKEGRHGWVGVGVVERKGEDGRSHISISHLYDGTPALTSGLKPGDEVLRINNRPISTAGDVLDASFFSQVGQDITVIVSREGKEVTCQFTVEARPTAMPAVAAGTPAPGGSTPAPASQEAVPGESSTPAPPGEGSGSQNSRPQTGPTGRIATGPDAPAAPATGGTTDGGVMPISGNGSTNAAPEK